jgi:hypothetical protein
MSDELIYITDGEGKTMLTIVKDGVVSRHALSAGQLAGLLQDIAVSYSRRERDKIAE